MRAVVRLAVASLLCTAAAAADVLHLVDGSRLDGKLTFCDEEACSIDKRRIPREQITRITLRVPSSRSHLREAGAILTDGTTRRGAFTGLTLGYVEIGGEEIDRETVAVIVVEAPANDVVIGSDGSSRRGVISSCNAAGCTLDDAVIPLRDIRWLGFRARNTSPPVAGDEDLIFVREQQTVTARVSALDDQSVRTTRGVFPRDDVTWIRLATPPDDAAPEGTRNAPSPEQRPPEESPAPPPAPPPAPSATPPSSFPAPPAQRSAGTPRRGALWIGTMEGRGWGTTNDIFSDLRISVQARLREYISPLVVLEDGQLETVGTTTQLEPEGTVVRNVYRCRSQGLTCSGEGSTTVSVAFDEQGVGHASWIIAKSREDSMQETHGYDIPQGAAFYVLGIDAGRATYPVEYRNTYGTTREDTRFTVWMVGAHPLSIPTIGDREVRYLQDGKMIGSFTAPGSGAFPHLSMSWAICREGVACPAPPPLPDAGAPPTPPLCSDGPQLDFAKLCRDDLARLLGRLFPMLAEYERRQKAADQFWPDFKWAAAQCAAWKIAETALTAALSGLAADLGAAGANAQKVRELLNAMIEGDYGGLVLDADLWEENEQFQAALENTTTFLDTLDKVGSVASLMAMDVDGFQAAIVDSCAGAVSPELHRKAELFVELSKDAAAYYKENVAVTKNDIRSKTLECLQKDHNAWKACRDAAACRGETLDLCGPDPMSTAR